MAITILDGVGGGGGRGGGGADRKERVVDE